MPSAFGEVRVVELPAEAGFFREANRDRENFDRRHVGPIPSGAPRAALTFRSCNGISYRPRWKHDTARRAVNGSAEKVAGRVGWGNLCIS